MNGMTLQQYVDILKFINEYHNFGKLNCVHAGKVEKAIEGGITDELAKYGHNIKYIRNSFDMRTMEVWSIEFSGLGNNIRFATNFPYFPSELPKDWKYDNLYDLSMAYLKGEFTPDEKFKIEL